MKKKLLLVHALITDYLYYCKLQKKFVFWKIFPKEKKISDKKSFFGATITQNGSTFILKCENEFEYGSISILLNGQERTNICNPKFSAYNKIKFRYNGDIEKLEVYINSDKLYFSTFTLKNGSLLNDFILNYKFVNNNSKRLVIICNAAPTENRLNLLLQNSPLGSKKYIRKLKKFSREFTFFSLSKNIDADFIYLIDDFSTLMGYYFIDHENYIAERISKELDFFITENKYENVVILGSSKGGFGSMLLGRLCENVDTIISVIPQINLSNIENWELRSDQVGYIELQNILFGNSIKSDITKKATNIVNSKTEKKEIIITGVNDIFFDSLKNYSSDKTTFYLDMETKGHSAIAAANFDEIKLILSNSLENKSYISSVLSMYTSKLPIEAVERKE